MKSRDEVNILKRQWHDDPIWELPDTEGFEDHKEELQGFQNMTYKIGDEVLIKAKIVDIYADYDGMVFLILPYVHPPRSSISDIVSLSENEFKEYVYIENNKEEINELRHALESSRQYADKLVEGIPYLPKDFEIAKQANWDFAAENDKLKSVISALLKIIDDHGDQIIKSHSSEIASARKVLGNYDNCFLEFNILKNRSEK